MLDAMQREVDATSARIASSAFELDMLRSELDSLREQVCSDFQCFFHSRYIGQDTPKIVCFRYL